MNQLTVGDLERIVNRVKGLKNYQSIPIFLGDDDELNGIHNGWYIEVIKANVKDSDTKYVNDLVKNCLAIDEKLPSKYILIS